MTLNVAFTDAYHLTQTDSQTEIFLHSKYSLFLISYCLVLIGRWEGVNERI